MDAEIARDLDEIRARLGALAADLNDAAATLRDLGERAAAAPAPPELLPAREVGRRLAVSESAVYEAIAAGRLPSIRFGRAVRVPADVVEALQRGARRTGEAGSNTVERPSPRRLERRPAPPVTGERTVLQARRVRPEPGQAEADRLVVTPRRTIPRLRHRT